MNSNDGHISSLLQGRLNQIEEDMRVQAKFSISISYDPSGTHLYSLLEHTSTYPKRFGDLAQAIKQLLSKEHILPAAILARNLIETIAVGCQFIDEMNDILQKKDRKNLEIQLQRYISGRNENFENPIDIDSALKYLINLDAEYISSLELKTGIFSDSLQAIKEQSLISKLTSKSLYERMSVRSCYDQLSIATHPSTYSLLLYPSLENQDKETQRLLSSIKFSCFSAIGHGRHLLFALKKMENFAERFRPLL